MNRSERRRLAKQDKVVVPSEPVINIKSSDIKNIKQKAAKDAVDIAFLMMLAFPTMILHDRYSSLMKKQVDGKSREERFVEMCLDLYDSFEKGYVTVEDLHQCLWEEAGIKIERGR